MTGRRIEQILHHPGELNIGVYVTVRGAVAVAG